MEYVVVTYETERDVYIDRQFAGLTGDTLMVEAGNHFFDLGRPHDYLPRTVSRLVENTTAISPMIMGDFHPKADVV